MGSDGTQVEGKQMKETNEARALVKQRRVDYILLSLSATPEELERIRQDDPERHEAMLDMRNAIGRQLARNMRNVSRD
jgi:hypothetical protein